MSLCYLDALITVNVLGVSVDQVRVSNNSYPVTSYVASSEFYHVRLCDWPRQILFFFRSEVHRLLILTRGYQGLLPTDKVQISVKIRSRHFIWMRSLTLCREYNAIHHMVKLRPIYRHELPHITWMETRTLCDHHLSADNFFIVHWFDNFF